MDSEQLKARSIELAERAYRQKDRATDPDVKKRLDDAADELIKTTDVNRFFTAQSKLESLNLWTEEQRALAHELSVADQAIRNIEAIDSSEAIHRLSNWAQAYVKSPSLEVSKFGSSVLEAIRGIDQASNHNIIKQSFSYLISATEILLKQAQAIEDNQPQTDNILALRGMRDSLLSVRELLIDNEELLIEDAHEDQQVDRIELAHNALNEIYSHIEPVQIPEK